MEIRLTYSASNSRTAKRLVERMESIGYHSDNRAKALIVDRKGKTRDSRKTIVTIKYGPIARKKFIVSNNTEKALDEIDANILQGNSVGNFFRGLFGGLERAFEIPFGWGLALLRYLSR